MELSHLCAGIIFASLTVRWFKRDTLARGYLGILDRGMFVMTGGPVLLPLYVLWTRRLKGFLLLLLAFLCLIIPGFIVMLIMH